MKKSPQNLTTSNLYAITHSLNFARTEYVRPTRIARAVRAREYLLIIFMNKIPTQTHTLYPHIKLKRRFFTKLFYINVLSSSHIQNTHNLICIYIHIHTYTNTHTYTIPSRKRVAQTNRNNKHYFYPSTNTFHVLPLYFCCCVFLFLLHLPNPLL